MRIENPRFACPPKVRTPSPSPCGQSILSLHETEYSDQDHDQDHPRATLPDERSPCQATTMAAQADPMASTDPSLEICMSESRAAPVDFGLDSAHRAIEPSEQQLSSMSILGDGAQKHILNIDESIDSQAVLGDSTRATASPSKEWSQRKQSPSARVSSPPTPAAVAPAPSCSISLQRSPIWTNSGQYHIPDRISEGTFQSSGMFFTSYNFALDPPNNVLAAENRVAPYRDAHNGPVDGEGQASSPDPFTIRRDHDDARYPMDGDGSTSGVDADFSNQSEERSSGSITGKKSTPDSRLNPTIEDLGSRGEKATGETPRNLQTGSDGLGLGRNGHTLAKAPSVASRSKELGPDHEDSESASDTDDDDQDSVDRWEYRRIVARRIDSSGRRMAMVEWKNTWEPEDQLDGLEKALRRYAQERWTKQTPAADTCLKWGTKKRKCPI